MTASVVEVIDTVPMNDARIIYNKVLLEMQATLRRATTPFDEVAARLNVAVTHIQLGDWEEACRMLDDVDLPDSTGVSAGTVAYLTGLCLEGIGRLDAARAAFGRAAEATGSTLAVDGPDVSLLARRKLAELPRD